MSTILASFLRPPDESLAARRESRKIECKYIAKSGRARGNLGYGVDGVEGTVKHFDKSESPAPARNRPGRGEVVYEYGKILTSPFVYLCALEACGGIGVSIDKYTIVRQSLDWW